MTLPSHIDTLRDLAIHFDMLATQSLAADAAQANKHAWNGSSGALAYARAAAYVREYIIAFGDRDDEKGVAP